MGIIFDQTGLQDPCDPVGSKVLERNIFVSSSDLKAEKEQPDHEVNIMINENKYDDQWEQG